MSNPKTPSAWGIELSKLWMVCGQNFPVDVKQIAPEVTKTRFPDEPVGIIKAHGITGIDGMLSKRKKGDWCISYDDTVTVPGRINFTLGHEFGHYLLHRKLREKFQCGQGDMLDYESTESKKLESEANNFASYLLMPINDFRKQIQGQAVTLDLLRHCAERYGTSFTATALKWLEFTEKAALLVVARDHFICWSYPSKLASKRGTYLRPGTPVPQSALDRLNHVGTKRVNQSCRVSQGIWHSEMEAEESVIISDNFDLAIFLVQFPTAKRIIEHEEEEIQDTFTVLSNRAQGFNWSK
ncbi:ImmA/IrrE family metallo-endopeptidase [Methylobacter svalbardensis]|uniref:ImmA/IrrE family metallo-endopeptidase n=1 Tax=Methylobacter svalbardensis TaxID=3080016 RepID=UPI0030EF4F0F